MALDEAAFNDAYRSHAGRLRSVAYAVLHDRDAAEDAVHSALMRIWSGGSYRADRGALLPFLIACVRREALDTVRGSKRRHLREVKVVADEPVAIDDTAAIDPVEARRIRLALDTLPEPQRDVINRAYFGHRTLLEVARETDLPLGTVKSRLAAGLRRLHTVLTPGVAPS
jgi:RNA polymerase sigma-70 factor (ECF subfamily)